MFFSKVLNLEFNSALLRFFLSLYYKPDRFYKIPFGALRGFRIWYDRTINYHAVLGIWEKDNFDTLQKVVPLLLKEKQSFVVYDVGANIGLFSLYFSKYSPPVKLVAFEAVSATCAALERNLVGNSITDVIINQCAAAGHDGEVTFFVGHHHKSSLMKDWASDGGKSNTEEITVPAVMLDTYARANNIVPDFIKIDVEGGADKVLAGCSLLFEKNRPVVLIESHNPAEDKAIMQVLKAFAYDAFRIDNQKWVKNKSNDYRDRDGVWGTLILAPMERTAELAVVLQ